MKRSGTRQTCLGSWPARTGSHGCHATGALPAGGLELHGFLSPFRSRGPVKNTPAGASEPHADMWEGKRCWGPFLRGEASVELGVSEGTSKPQLTCTVQLGG